MAEEAVSSQARGFPWVIVRPPNVLGPRQKELEETIRLVKRRIKPLMGRHEPRTSLCYVWDVVEALILCAEKPEANGEIFFVSDSRPYAWSEITKAIQEELGNRRALVKVPYAVQLLAGALAETSARFARKKPRLTRQNVEATRKHFWVYDGSKISRTLGFQPQTGLKEAIRETVRWYREHGLI
jgi:nucleoside-diphosphate-sugar epimerase